MPTTLAQNERAGRRRHQQVDSPRGQLRDRVRVVAIACSEARILAPPQILADRQPHPRPIRPHLDHDRARAGREVPVLVEHVVRRQQSLIVIIHEGVVAIHDQRVGDAARVDRQGRTEHGCEPGRRALPDAPGDLGAPRDEALLQQQVLGRIPADRKLGKDHKVRVPRSRPVDILLDQRRVIVEITDRRIDLRQCDPHAGRSYASGASGARSRRSGRSHAIEIPASVSDTIASVAVTSSGTAANAS